jgi:hypothetical protein
LVLITPRSKRTRFGQNGDRHPNSIPGGLVE